MQGMILRENDLVEMDGLSIKQKCFDIVRQAKSSRIKYVYSALVDIRKTYLKKNGDTGIDHLISAGLVGRLVELIRTRESLDAGYKTKVLDIALSILGNLCMQEKVRAQVLKTDVIQELGELFGQTDVESLLNRSCRCLANILLSPKSWEPVHDLEILEKLAELLSTTKDYECKQTFIRAVRLLGQTPKHVSCLVEYSLVSAVLKHLDAENQDVAAVSLRCVLSLSNHGCSPKFALQVGKSGKVEYIMGLLEESNKDVLHLICQLSAYVDFRPYFGNAGGIIKFIENFQSTELPYKDWRIETLNVLCLCCQESVNRVKLRENGALKLLVESISNPEFKVLQERIISALVCFRYDEEGRKILLDLGMAQLLCRLLRSHIDKTEEAHHDYTETEREKYSSQNQGGDGAVLDKPEKGSGEFKDMSDTVQEKQSSKEDIKSSEKGEIPNDIKDKQNCEKDIKQTEATSTQSQKPPKDNGSTDDYANKDTSTLNESIIDDAFENGIILNGSNQYTDENPIENEHNETTKVQRPKYSINSPTYESVAQALDESYDSGAKCIESFTPPYNHYSSTAVSYSPLSISSYYSPSGSSPEYSESSPSGLSSSADRGRSRVRSTRSQSHSSPHSPRAPVPKYTGFTWSPVSSPVSSPERSTSPPGLKNLDLLDTRPSFSPGSDSIGALSEHRDAESASPCSETDPIFDNEEYQYSPVISSIDFNEQIWPNKNKIENDEDSVKRIDEEYIKTIQNKTSGDEIKADSIGNVRPEGQETERKAMEAKTKSKDAEPKSNDTHDTKEKHTENLNADTDSSTKVSENKTFELKRPDVKTGKKFRRKRKRPSDHTAVFEYNILILLDSVQVTNASLYIVTEEMLVCLLDYIRVMDTPQAKCARLLSRTFRDRHCFEKLMKLKIPLLVYKKLLLGQDYYELVMSLGTKKKTDSRSRRDSTMSDSSVLDPDRFSVVNEDDDDKLETKEQPRKRRKASESIDEHQTNKSPKEQNNMDICSREKSGVAFLEDFTSVAFTAFGQGDFEKVLITCRKDQYINICMCVPFIISTANSRRFYFKQLNVLDKLIEVLENIEDGIETHSKNVRTILDGFSYLAKVSSFDSRYCNRYLNQSTNYGGPEMLKNTSSVECKKVLSAYETQRHLEHSYTHPIGCKVNNENSDSDTCDSIVFVLDGGRVIVNRSVIMKKSEILYAMLRGGYKESNLQEIPLLQTSYIAFRYIIHTLYGCGNDCEAISYLHLVEPSRETAKHCIDLLTEADKYLLPTLKENLLHILVGRFLVPDCAYPVFEYTVVNDNIDLQKAVVANLFVHGTPNKLYDLCMEYLQSNYKDSFLHTLVEILTD